jgi:predicted CoA-substrate-specific enzyme activase
MIAPATTATRWLIGLDVGSTAVKAVALGAEDLRVVHREYLRHGTRQANGTLRLLRHLEEVHPGLLREARVFFTGSGGRALARRTGCRAAQEVNAVALAVERLHPDAGSVIDLGGQDAKIIIWVSDPRTGRRRKLFSMNDKCAGGTGSVIDRIGGKLGMSPDDLAALRINGHRLHPIAARCGVFAETDINGLQKQGVPRDELLASLFEAIVQQNLSVLTRGATLLPPALLVGGPHAFLPGLVDAWRGALGPLWRERGVGLPAEATIEELVRVPADACYFAALGAVYFGLAAGDGAAAGPHGLEVLRLLEQGAISPIDAAAEPGLIAAAEEREELERVARQAQAHGLAGGSGYGPHPMDVVIGLDAGSTSTKAVLLDLEGALRAKAYRLSGGDPLEDARAVLGDLASQARAAGAVLRVRGLGTTGYAKDMLGGLLAADLALVETVAHTRSALAAQPDVEVVVDVGGQDIKVLILRDGRVRDFRLNSQCSAGNGYFLQSTALRFGIPVEAFAEHAFQARRCPRFNVGCGVFLEADIVNCQQMGWQPSEILAGLARVLPRNVWLHVVGEPNLARLGRSFILQGGTQRNQAAVKAQIDYIRARVPDARIAVHPHAGESGAIGVALELLRRGVGSMSRFIGFDAVAHLAVTARQDESTRCSRCANRCARTVLEARRAGGETTHFVIASCDAGRVLEDTTPTPAPARSALSGAGRPAADFSRLAARVAFATAPRVEVGAAVGPALRHRLGWLPGAAQQRAAHGRRQEVRIGIPRALNLYQCAPFFIAYLEALGIEPERIIVSPPTTEALFRRGVLRGAVDNCYPGKVALAHVHDLLHSRACDWIFLPILVNVPQEFADAIDASVCPSSQAMPEVIKAAFTREGDQFAAHGVRYLDPVLHMAEPALFARELLDLWGPLLGVTRAENARAIALASAAQRRALEEELRRPALAEIERLEASGGVGIVVLGRPYHDDPGLNHGIFQDLARRGYPIFSIQSLPRDERFLAPLFREEIALGRVGGVMAVGDVWRHSFSANSNAKLWAAKVVARHPHLVALDVSSFRCGHDAPIYATVEAILEAARTPYFTFHEIDENRPSGAIRLRVETIDYFLGEFQARLRQGAGGPSGPASWAAAAARLTEEFAAQ